MGDCDLDMRRGWVADQDVVFCVACRGGRAGSAGRLDLHWFSSGIDHDTDIDGEQENADG
jgi:hypothetical protein